VKTSVLSMPICLALPCIAGHGPAVFGRPAANTRTVPATHNPYRRQATPLWGLPAGFDDFDPPPDFTLRRDEKPRGLPLLVMPPPEAGPPAPPPPPVQPVLHEYSWPDSATPAAATFAIVSKDGTVMFASGIWVQSGELNFAAPNGKGGRLNPGAVDYATTRRLNAERGLVWPLPPPREPKK
jgi:hypothetical protein